MIIRHYLRRVLVDPVGIGVYILFPIALITVLAMTSNYLTQGYDHLINGYDLNVSMNMIINLLLFQLMGSLIVIDFLYEDLRGEMRWRLLATPVPVIRFVLANLLASVSFAVISGLMLIGVSAFVFNAYLHNVWVLLSVLVLMAVMSQLVGILFFLVFKRKGTANTMGTLFCWVMVLLSGFMMGISFGEAITRIGRLYTPFAWAFRAIIYSGEAAGLGGMIEAGGMTDALLNLGYLAGFTVLLVPVVVVLAKREWA
jgi:hypothetical protein